VGTLAFLALLEPRRSLDFGGDPDPSGRAVYAAFQGDDIVELVVDSGEGTFGAMLSELKERFGLSLGVVPGAGHDVGFD